jgi:NTE family protein
MTDLRSIPLFAGLSDAAIARLRERLCARRYSEGDVILRAGDPPTEMHIIVEGAARIELDAAWAHGRRALLGPAQAFGEMSVLSGSPVSATVLAQRDTTTLALSGEDLATVLEAEPALYRNISAMLVHRLRHRTQADSIRLQPAVAILILHSDSPSAAGLLRSLARGIGHYAPGSLVFDARSGELAALLSRIARWREEAAGGQYLIVVSSAARVAAMRGVLIPGDAALHVREAPESGTEEFELGPVDAQTVLLGGRPSSGTAGRWADSVSQEELAACCADGERWNRDRYPSLDRLARYVTFREVGVALSVGAAAGLAHLGFLEVLEQAGIPIDFLCGSSMGGTVALGYGQCGNAPDFATAICKLGAQFAKARGIQILPRGSLVSRRRFEELTRQLFGERTFAELCRPVAVVSADLVAGQRVILDSGSIAAAAWATSAIPGIFPPLRIGPRILVDGGLVTRVPADLLVRHRCGLRIASVVQLAMGESRSDRDAEADRLQSQLDRPLGLHAALRASWKLLGWWDAAAQAQKADLVVKIPVPARDGFDFAGGPRIIELGRQATLQRIAGIRAEAQRLLAPGVP